MKRNQTWITTALSLLVLSMLASCNLSAGTSTATTIPNTAAAVPTVITIMPTIVHLMEPADFPAAMLSNILDTNTAPVASQKRTTGGDSFNNNLFERPFSADMATYYPDLDVQSASLGTDATWYYVAIVLAGQSTGGGLSKDYAVELDLDGDGRGDMLIVAQDPGAAWSVNGVQVYTDPDKNVGGKTPILSDPPPQTGQGYYDLVFNAGVGSDPDAAWARLDPSNSAVVQIAFKRALINSSGHFLWGAWAMDPSMFHPGWFDYDDHFTAAQAGSPLVNDPNYPLKALYEVDNTCRWAVGFTPTGNEPGICPVPPTPTPVPTSFVCSQFTNREECDNHPTACIWSLYKDHFSCNNR
jgi:hypothetical protein